MNGRVKDGEAYAKFVCADKCPFFTVLVRDDPSGEGEFKFAQSRGYYDAEQILFDSHRGRFIAGGV